MLSLKNIRARCNTAVHEELFLTPCMVGLFSLQNTFYKGLVFPWPLHALISVY